MKEVLTYAPTGPEILITLGIYGIGFLIITVLWKVGIGVRKEIEAT